MITINRMNSKIGKLNNPFTALKHKNFRYYWFGMCISLIGTWMQNIAQPWLAYSLTNSPLKLSLVGTLQFAPVFFLSFFAGVIIDKFPKKKILVFTQSASLVITFTLATLVWMGNIQYWQILVAAAALGIINTLDMPTRQTFVIELVGKEDLMNAIALNSSVFNLARILGPAMAGVVMAWAGVDTCFYANSFSFAAVIVSLCFIKPMDTTPRRMQKTKILDEIRDGFFYIFKEPLLLKTLAVVAVVSTFAMNYNVLVPVFAKTVLKQEETGFGFLMSFIGAGSFVGAMTIATLSKGGPMKFVLNIVPFFIAFALILTGITNVYLLTGLGLAIAGLCFVSFSSTANSIMQLNTVDEYRGRVMSIYTWIFSGWTPIGNLFAGWVTDRFGPKAGFIACGLTIILLIGLLRMFYRQKLKKNSDT